MIMTRTANVWLTAFLITVSADVCAQDKIVTLEGMQIRGEQEVPLVLYLVPWQSPEARSLDPADEPLMLSRPIRSIARSEFRRLIDYHQTFQVLNGSPNATPELESKSR